jgi:hypothetical protein
LGKLGYVLRGSRVPELLYGVNAILDPEINKLASLTHRASPYANPALGYCRATGRARPPQLAVSFNCQSWRSQDLSLRRRRPQGFLPNPVSFVLSNYLNAVSLMVLEAVLDTQRENNGPSPVA